MKTQKQARDLLERAIEASGLSGRAFAEDVLLRDERTLRRWRAGVTTIPGRVIVWLEDPQPAPWPKAAHG